MDKEGKFKEIKIFTRQCHDCKRKTNNYRCPECLEAWKTKHRVSSNALEYEPTTNQSHKGSHKA